MAVEIKSKRYGLVNTGLAVCLSSFLLLSLSSCVSTGTHEAMIMERDKVSKERDQLMDERDQLIRERDRLSSRVIQTKKEKREAAKEAEAAKQQIAEQRQVYRSLEETFAKEREANQVKIEMMKSGVKVNLANEILFASGSAQLNEMGVEVLTRAAAELLNNPYQTVVAGFTDDVQISQGLKAKYPSNWELAGARAASVVRLLEEQGVPSNQLLALSFGENSPVASNEDPEGRSKNRRIEIILRPAPITMD